ncbi:MAG: helix-turn-helix domain-containing protein [Pseudomonadales bacterium]|nr:helix-turn-helix domain-containing protein [Pseudomonadales bacterium]
MNDLTITEPSLHLNADEKEASQAAAMHAAQGSLFAETSYYEELLADERLVSEHVDGAELAGFAALCKAEAAAISDFGELLRAARIAKSLSIEDVSCATHIAQAHIEALESSLCVALPITFAKGYAKGYAGFLGIEPELLTKYLSAMDEPSKQVAAPAEKGFFGRHLVGFVSGSSWSNGLLGSPMGLLRMATSTALPLLCLCVLAFAYHSIDNEFTKAGGVAARSHSLGQAPDQLGVLAHEAVSTQASPSVNYTISQALVRAPSLGAVRDVSAASGVALQGSPQFETPTIANLAVSAASNLALSSGVLPDSSQQTPESPQPSMPANQSLVQLAGSQPPAAIANNAGLLAFETRAGRLMVPNSNIQGLHEPVGPGAVEMIAQLHMQDRLVIEVYEDSWVDVRDGAGMRLYRDLARAGRRIDVSGQLPFSLHLGNAPGLELQLNGEPIAIKRFRSDNSARLTLASN